MKSYNDDLHVCDIKSNIKLLINNFFIVSQITIPSFSQIISKNSK